jgi:hypothetical protein
MHSWGQLFYVDYDVVKIQPIIPLGVLRENPLGILSVNLASSASLSHQMFYTKSLSKFSLIKSSKDSQGFLSWWLRVHSCDAGYRDEWKLCWSCKSKFEDLQPCSDGVCYGPDAVELAAPINVSLGLVLMNQTNMVWCELIELRCLVDSYPETNAFLKKRKKCWHSIQG